MLRKVIADVGRHGRRAVERFAGFSKGKGPQEGIPRAPRDFQPATVPRASGQVGQVSGNRSTILQRYFANNVYPSLAQELRQSFQFRLHSGSFPLFGQHGGLSRRLCMYAFVTMGVASWTQMQEDEEGKDAIYGSIRAMVQGKQRQMETARPQQEPIEEVGLHSLQFGPMIAKGCDAAVYQARYRGCSVTSSDIDVLEEEEELSQDSDIEVISEDDIESIPPQDFSLAGTSDGSDIQVIPDDSDIEVLDESLQESGPDFHRLPSHLDTPGLSPDSNFDLAIKMMFNYDVESVAGRIWREMQNELVPAKMADTHLHMDTWQNGCRAKIKRLPPHPNIVDMDRAFVGDVPHLLSAFDQYPDALPERINPEGCGRNKTLFIVMKRYRYTLREYLEHHQPTVRQATMLLTQLLEAVIHMLKHNVAHRDLKSNNILVETDHAGQPHLVVTDFGHCLPQSEYGLRVPYVTEDQCKGGNGALMAPEIACASPGQWLDYSASDLWAVGAIAYEVFGACNPFYRNTQGHRLDSPSYTEGELPPLPDCVPHQVQQLVRQMLAVNPAHRPSAETVADLLHLGLWHGDLECDLVSENKVILRRCLLNLTAKVIFAPRSKQMLDTMTSLQMSFLSRIGQHALHNAEGLLNKCSTV